MSITTYDHWFPFVNTVIIIVLIRTYRNVRYRDIREWIVNGIARTDNKEATSTFKLDP